MANFSERLRDLRKKRDLSQVALAEKVGLSGQVISQYERGVTRPDYETLLTIADYFNVSTDYLLGNTDVTVRLVNEDELNLLDRFSEDTGIRHYINDDTLALAQQLHDDKDLRMMFDTVKNLSPDAMQYVKDTLLYLEKIQKRQ